MFTVQYDGCSQNTAWKTANYKNVFFLNTQITHSWKVHDNIFLVNVLPINTNFRFRTREICTVLLK